MAHWGEVDILEDYLSRRGLGGGRRRNLDLLVHPMLDAESRAPGADAHRRMRTRADGSSTPAVERKIARTDRSRRPRRRRLLPTRSGAR